MTKARDLANSAAAFASVSATELGYVDGVTSAIQTQIDTKAPSSTAATLTGTQTLTNKTIDTASNTITGAVTLTGTQTLTNKTLTSPVIASVINNTLTSTTGDIIYASAANTPARLGIGTTGQVLNVASGIPAWATASSGALALVKARTNFNSVATTGTTFDGVFTSTYANYIIVLDYISSVNANDTLKFQWRSGGTTYSGGNYYSGYNNVTWNGTSAPVGNSGGTYVSVGTLAAGGNSANYTINYYSPQDTSANHKVAFTGYSPQLQGNVFGAGFVNTTTTNYDGFIISCSTGNIYTLYATVYGLVKS